MFSSFFLQVSKPRALREQLIVGLVRATLVPFLFISFQGLAQEMRPALIPSAQGTGSGNTSALTSGIGELTEEPIVSGQVVHVSVFNAPDFSVVARVSEDGAIAVPMVGSLHVEGLNSETASVAISSELKRRNLMLDPHVIVTVESSSSGITVLGEVHSPGVYPLPGRALLSDVIAIAGGLTANTGRVIEVSNERNPNEKTEIPWDPTMHDTTSFDHAVHPGDRILVRACGIAYMGGHVAKPGAYSLCGSRQITLSEAVALAGGVIPLTSDKHIFLVRVQSDGSRTAEEVDLHKVLMSQAADPVLREDDIVYVTPSTIKDVVNRALAVALTLSNAILYTYHP
jgi:polysaccharide biosynthesis/export protein